MVVAFMGTRKQPNAATFLYFKSPLLYIGSVSGKLNNIKTALLNVRWQLPNKKRDSTELNLVKNKSFVSHSEL